MDESTYGRLDASIGSSVAGAAQTRTASAGRLERQTFRRVRAYVEAHLDSRLDVYALARLVGLSPSQFSRLFQKAVGVSPHRYVVQCRVTRARELLATTRLSLTEIALTIGFADHSHFSRRFHEFTGVPPREFRRLGGATSR